tara:strand:- start:931 stop:1128 length:198 start_codon:yes stop_codon:yes gene_type:complete
MAKFTRFDPRNKKRGRNKSKTLENEFKKKIRMTEDHRPVHRYRGAKINSVVDEVGDLHLILNDVY